MCKKRWSERDISYKHFYLAMPHVVEALQIMIGTHPDLATFLETYTTGWDTDFIVGIISQYRLLHPVASITQKLQCHTVDVIAAFNGVKDCINDMKAICEGEFSIIYQQAECMDAKFGVTTSIPRTAVRQLNRNNIPALTPEEYF